MSTEIPSLVYDQFIKAPPQEVFRMFTNSTAMRDWISDVATADPKPGGRLYFAWNGGFYACGEYTAVEKDRCVAFTWLGRGEPAPSLVTVTISGQDGGSQFKLEHSGLPAGEMGEKLRQIFDENWQSGLENLVSVLETGEDIRFVRRPMVGITVSDFNAEIAAQHGIPVSQGIRLDSTLEGMGAAAAGLQGGDVLVELGGHPLVDYSSLSVALLGRRAGDVVEVKFYRGAEKKTVQMKLSGRPIPPIPATPQLLAQEVSKMFAKVEADLSEFFEGVTETEAEFHPAPGEWNAKEILAHLIHGERGGQQYLDYLLGLHEPWFDDYSGNLHIRNAATIAAYPRIADLLAELFRLDKETVAFLANISPDFMVHKNNYWRLAYNYLQGPFHHEIHLEQMRLAIQAARKQ